MEGVRKAVTAFTIRSPQMVNLSHGFTLESQTGELLKFLKLKLYPRTIKSESLGVGPRYFKNLLRDSNEQLRLRTMPVDLKKSSHTRLQVSMNPLKLCTKFCTFFWDRV